MSLYIQSQHLCSPLLVYFVNRSLCQSNHLGLLAGRVWSTFSLSCITRLLHSTNPLRVTMKFSFLIPAVLATMASASPTRVLEKRATTWCDSYGSLETGGYTVYHNNWGAAQATSGSQCTTFDSVTSGSVSWSTSWSWTGGSSSVKSYSNIALVDVNTQLSAISSIPSTWTWTYVASRSPFTYSSFYHLFIRRFSVQWCYRNADLPIATPVPISSLTSLMTSGLPHLLLLTTNMRL